MLKSNLKAGKEGILVAAKNGTYNKMELIYEADSKQMATFEIGYPNNNVRLTVAHGPQEDADIEEREEFYVDLHAELQRGLESKCQVLLVGDFNARLVHVAGHLQECHGNGNRLKEVVDKFELNVLSIQPGTEGKWTRIQEKGDILCKSEIDYIITDPTIKFQRTIIDEDKMFTPYRMKKTGNEKVIVFSDHCAMTTNLEIKKGTTKEKPPLTEKSKRWVLTREGIAKY